MPSSSENPTPDIGSTGLPWWPDGKESACNGDPGWISESGRSSGEGNGSPLQYSCLENPLDRGAWGSTVHGVARANKFQGKTYQANSPATRNTALSSKIQAAQSHPKTTNILGLPHLPATHRAVGRSRGHTARRAKALGWYQHCRDGLPGGVSGKEPAC